MPTPFPGYDLIIDYRRSPEPPLSAEDAVWARQILAEKLS
jgi:hypothetical protein